MILNLTRNTSTNDAVFGTLQCGNFSCVTMERIAVMIPKGTFNITMQFSPHFQFITPHLDVPGRTYIEIHPANYPYQLEGCIAVGQQIDGDSLDHSRKAFDDLMAALQGQTDLQIVIA